MNHPSDLPRRTTLAYEEFRGGITERLADISWSVITPRMKAEETLALTGFLPP